MKKCENCNGLLQKTDRRNEMADLDEDATEGQYSDYVAAELSGDYGDWNIGIVEYQCKKCSRVYQIQDDVLPDYRELIIGWHKKAADQEDSFSSFVFEYLAFIAHIKNNVYFWEPKDRKVIQLLKQDQVRRAVYLKKVGELEDLHDTWVEVIGTLSHEPLLNTSQDADSPEIGNWWNKGNENEVASKKLKEGVIHSLDDWNNMVEFWYSVRNNLFHGGKNPNISRDCFLVESAYQTLRPLMDIEVAELTGVGQGRAEAPARGAKGKPAGGF